MAFHPDSVKVGDWWVICYRGPWMVAELPDPPRKQTVTMRRGHGLYAEMYEATWEEFYCIVDEIRLERCERQILPAWTYDIRHWLKDRP